MLPGFRNVDTGLVRLTLLEASLFLSLPGWMLMAERGWPADRPLIFAGAVATGASLATLTCHVLPALYGRWYSGHRHAPWTRYIWQAALAILAIGAALSLAQMARFAAYMLSIGHFDDPAWSTASSLLTMPFAAVPLAIAFARPRSIAIGAAASTLLGAVILVFLLIAQWDGLWIRNPQMGSEVRNDPAAVVVGMLLAAAPGATVAQRVGVLATSRRSIWLTGLAGVWLPAAFTSTGFSLARMAGARQYWKPSLPIDFTYAMCFRSEDTMRAVWILSGLTALGPCIVCGLWLRSALNNRTTPSQTILIIIGVALIGFGLTSQDGFPWGTSYVPLWAWTALIASSLTGLIVLIRSSRSALSPHQ